MNRIHPALQGVYAGRSIDLQNLPALIQSIERQPLPPAELLRAHAGLFVDNFAERARRLELLHQNRDALALVDRQHRVGEIDSFLYGSRRYDSADARRMLIGIDRQLDDEERWWADFDRRLFRIHYQMARDLGAEAARDLRLRYEFHLGLQEIEGEMSRRRRTLSRVASFVNDTDGPLSYADFHDVRAELMESYDAFGKCLQKACRLRPPNLKGLPPDQPLANAFLSEAPVAPLKPVAQTVSGRWVGKFARQLDEMRNGRNGSWARAWRNCWRGWRGSPTAGKRRPRYRRRWRRRGRRIAGRAGGARIPSPAARRRAGVRAVRGGRADRAARRGGAAECGAG